jgi:hypothetical protein
MANPVWIAAVDGIAVNFHHCHCVEAVLNLNIPSPLSQTKNS